MFLDDNNTQFDIPLGYNKGETLNIGIAIITPAQEIYELLMSEQFESMRKQILDNLPSVETITQDSNLEMPMKIEVPKTSVFDTFYFDLTLRFSGGA